MLQKKKKKKSVLFSEVHLIMNFREAPHQIGPSLFSHAIACSPKRNRSWQYLVKTWQKPETRRRAFSDNKNALVAVAMLAGKGNMSLFGDVMLEGLALQETLGILSPDVEREVW